MQISPGKRIGRDDRVYFILLGGIFYLALQILLIKPGVFFSGDAGVKFLMVKQLAGGNSPVEFAAQKPAWVESIWSQGFFPVKEPFVYSEGGRRIFAFPPAFEWLTLPFYHLAGFRGLFILPALSLLILWITFWGLAKRATKDRNASLLALFILIGCSPLTAYGTLFWEHTLAAALSFAGCWFIIRPPRSAGAVFLLGLLSGSACFFRIELAVFNALLGVAVLYHFSLQRSVDSLIFLAGLFISMAALATFNYSVYTSLSGAQGRQFFPGSETHLFKPSVPEIFTHLNLRLLQYFPLVLVLPWIWFKTFKGKTWQPSIFHLTYIISCFLVIVPFLVPNAGGKQLGPRYLLPVIAPLLLLALLAIRSPEKLRYYHVFMPVIIGLGLTVNIYFTFVKTYTDTRDRILPLYEMVAHDSAEVVIVQNQYIAQELADLFEEKHFFVAETPAHYSKLYYLLMSARVDRFIYLSSADDRPGLERVGGYYVSTGRLR